MAACPGEAAVRRGFTGWLRRVLLPQRLPELNDLEEVSAMLAERVVEWTRQWREEGHKEGRHEGEALLLRRLLERRFGPLDAAADLRLAAADDEQLLLWAERILAAGSLEEVFAED